MADEFCYCFVDFLPYMVCFVAWWITNKGEPATKRGIDSLPQDWQESRKVITFASTLCTRKVNLWYKADQPIT